MSPTKNYHTHTFRCQHAKLDVADYCQAAVEQGLTVLGISDHTALPDNRWSRVRMDISELPDYCQAVDDAKQTFTALTVLKGAECEYMDQYVSFYEDELMGERQFDYLIGAAHYFPFKGDWITSFGGVDSLAALRAYSQYFIQSMESGLFAFMAHPDVFGTSYLTWDDNTISASRDMFAAAAQLQVPLEINGYGLRKQKIDTPQGRRCMYPWLPFWELAAEYDVRVIVNSDAHHPRDITGMMVEAREIGERLNLKFADLSYLETAH